MATDKFQNFWEIISLKYPLLFKKSLIEKKIEAIVRIQTESNSGSTLIYVIPYLFPLLLGHEPAPVKNQAVKSMDILLKIFMRDRKNIISQKTVICLRSIHLNMNQIGVLFKFQNADILLAIASLNENGFVREAVLDHCLHKNLELPLSFLLVRINDHVPVIREKAKILFQRYLCVAVLDDIFQNGDAFMHASKSVYAQDMNLLEEVCRVIKKTPFTTFLNSLETYSPGAQKIILRSFLTDFQEKPQLLADALDRIFPAVKVWAMRLTKTLDLPDAMVNKLLSDANAVIRRDTIRQIGPEKVQVFSVKLMAMTYDRSRRVRESARFILRSAGIDMIRRHYLHLIENHKNPSVHVIEALMEVSTIEDLDKVRLYISHRNKFVRASALKSLYRLLEKDAMEAVLQGLMDQSSLVRKIAALILKNAPAYYDEQIRSYLFSGPTHIKKTCFEILISKNRNKYTMLLDILQLLMHQEDILIERAFLALKNWAIPVYILPERTVYENIVHHILQIDNIYTPIKSKYRFFNDDWHYFKKKINILGKIVV